MTNKDFKNFCVYVQNAEENDSIWYAGYMWIDLTENQINKIVEIIKIGKNIVQHEIGNAIFQRSIIETPSGMKLYGNSKQVLKDIEDLVDGCSQKHACNLILGFYNEGFLTCGEYNNLYDWIEMHSDCNGRVTKDW